jgi:hypothetical protein
MKTRLNFAAALLAGGLALGAGQACAMPTFDHALTTTPQAAQPEQVRWVCGPWRCFWRPNYFYRPFAFYGPRPYWRPRPYWGFYRPYRPWGWGWRHRYW